MATHPFRLERYELQELLEQSGQAEVWKAFDTQEHRYVAVKFLRTHLQADPEYAARFQRDMQAIAFLRHPISCSTPISLFHPRLGRGTSPPVS